MKPVIRINFCDFWAGFVKEDNYFFNLLSKIYEVQIADDPDFLFYSCYGDEYLKYDCIRIFYTAENLRPDFSGCDYALSFDFLNHPRHYRMPLYNWYIDQLGQMDNIMRQRPFEEIRADWRSKKKFCCMLVSNPHAKKRINFFHKLSQKRHVDSGGRYLNNVGGPVKDKYEFIKDYRFVFSFENSVHPGYVTEKIVDPLFSYSIPIYWGSPNVEVDFNKNRFINYADFPDEDSLIERIIEIDENEELAMKILSEPVFPGNVVPVFLREENVLVFLKGIFNNRYNIVPVAKTNKQWIHSLLRKKRKITGRINGYLGLNFR